MIWDRGAHSTIISDAFRKYLTLPAHGLYRSDTGVKVQIDGEIRFSNTIVQIDWNCLVVPTSNQRVGVLLGQRGAIDRIIYTSAPRANLVARGLSLPPNVCVLWPIWWNPSIPTGLCPGCAFACTTRPRRSHRSSYFFYQFFFGEYLGSLCGNMAQQDVSQILILAACLHLCSKGFFEFVTNRCSSIIRQGSV